MKWIRQWIFRRDFWDVNQTLIKKKKTTIKRFLVCDIVLERDSTVRQPHANYSMQVDWMRVHHAFTHLCLIAVTLDISIHVNFMLVDKSTNFFFLYISRKHCISYFHATWSRFVSFVGCFLKPIWHHIFFVQFWFSGNSIRDSHIFDTEYGRPILYFLTPSLKTISTISNMDFFYILIYDKHIYLVFECCECRQNMRPQKSH